MERERVVDRENEKKKQKLRKNKNERKEKEKLKQRKGMKLINNKKPIEVKRVWHIEKK